MEGPPLGPVGEDITWPDQVAPRGRKASSTRKIKPQTSNLHHQDCSSASKHAAAARPHAPSYSFCRFGCPGQPLVLALYQTLHAPCSVLGGECNRPAWATRKGLQEPYRNRAFACRRRKCQSGIRREKEQEKLCVTLFCGCLFIINSVLGILLVVVDMLHGGVPKSPNCPRS